MNNTIKTELRAHLIQHVKDCYDADETDFSELHNSAFNDGYSYYIIGYYQANQWLKSHNIDAFDAIAYVMEQEEQHFGESHLKISDINSEKIVNLLVYFSGFDVMPSCDLDNISRDDLLTILEGQ
jgi:hypothetical protein